MRAKKNAGKKLIVTLLSLILVIGCTVGGTLAWLTAQTGTVTNTFIVGNINIELKEHKLQADGTLNNTTAGEVTSEDTYKVLPGTKQPKDPFVRVKADSEACYVFVQVQEVNNTVGTANYVDWEIADGWTQLGTTENGTTTYWREQAALTAENAEDAILFVLKGDTDCVTGVVTYANTLTKENIDALDTDGNDSIEDDEMPKLIFKAFAVQKEAGTDATTAWAQIPAADRLSN